MSSQPSVLEGPDSYRDEIRQLQISKTFYIFAKLKTTVTWISKIAYKLQTALVFSTSYRFAQTCAIHCVALNILGRKEDIF